MRLLVIGHWSHTGFGVVTERLATGFLARGLDARVIAVNHRGEPLKGPLAGRVWPADLMGEPFGANFLHGAINGGLWPTLDETDVWAPEAVLVISDMTGFMSHIGPRLHPAWLSVPLFHYCPIEGDNLPGQWAEVWNAPAAHQTVPPAMQEHFRGVQFHPVAMSDFGARVIGELTGRVIPRIYHGVDTDTFHRVSASNPIVVDGRVLRSKEDCKRQFGIDPGDTVILRTDRNVTRKFYNLYVEVMARVIAAQPRVKAVIHCAPEDPADGLNLYEDMSRIDAAIWPRFALTKAHDTFRGLPTAGLVALMNAADIYASTTGGEGFGLTLAEAAACEVPVVVTDWAADAETVGPGGVLVPPLIDRYGEPVRYHSRYGMDWAMPDVRGFTEALTTLAAKPHRRQSLGEAGRRHVTRSFRWDDACDQFLALFESALVPLEVAA